MRATVNVRRRACKRSYHITPFRARAQTHAHKIARGTEMKKRTGFEGASRLLTARIYRSIRWVLIGRGRVFFFFSSRFPFEFLVFRAIVFRNDRRNNERLSR